jgi:DNA-binding IclR family transcriptional regulator
MLSYDPERQSYAPGLRLVRYAHSAWRHSSLAQVAHARLDALASQVGETVHLAQLDSGQVLYVDKRNARTPVEMFSQAGKIGPAYCTGVGKAMLAFLDAGPLEDALRRQSFHRFTDHTFTTPAALKEELARIRARGYAFDDEEHEPGIICIAAPILSRTGRMLGALSVTSTTERTSLSALEKALAPTIVQTAAQIAEEAESWRFPEQDRMGGR